MRELGEDQADQVIAYTQKCVVAPLDTSVALHAADLHREYKLTTADVIVYATARQKGGAELLTCDAHFKGLPNTARCLLASSAAPLTQHSTLQRIGHRLDPISRRGARKSTR